MPRRDGIEGDTHLRCPQCTYDLHGIPKRRCPECGFGFDYAALRNLAELAEINREGVARRVMAAALVAIAAVYSAASEALHLYGAVQLLAGAAVFVPTYGGIVRFADIYDGLRSVPSLILAAAAWMLLTLMFFLGPGGLIIATGITAFAWVQRLIYWPRLYPPENSPHPDDRRYVDRMSMWSMGLLAAATACIGLAWLG